MRDLILKQPPPATADPPVLRLDPRAALPLYQQIVNGIRWLVGTGRIPPDSDLPSLRTAAERWDVNLHTVRKAYLLLEEQGLVRTRKGRRTRIARGVTPAASDAGSGLDRFLAQVLSEARESHGLSPAALLARLALHLDAPERSGIVALLECNMLQCAELAQQVEEAVGRTVIPWPLSLEFPPPGVLVGSTFHRHEMLERWPKREGDMVFGALVLDRATFEPVPESILTTKSRLVLLERDEATGAGMAADLKSMLGRASIRIATLRDLPSLLTERQGWDAMFVGPRVWATLSEEQRLRPGIHPVRYRFRPEDLRSIVRVIRQRSAG